MQVNSFNKNFIVNTLFSYASQRLETREVLVFFYSLINKAINLTPSPRAYCGYTTEYSYFMGSTKKSIRILTEIGLLNNRRGVWGTLLEMQDFNVRSQKTNFYDVLVGVMRADKLRWLSRDQKTAYSLKGWQSFFPYKKLVHFTQMKKQTKAWNILWAFLFLHFFFLPRISN